MERVWLNIRSVPERDYRKGKKGAHCVPDRDYRLQKTASPVPERDYLCVPERDLASVFSAPLSRGVAKSAVGEIVVDAPGTTALIRHAIKPDVNASEDAQIEKVRSEVRTLRARKKRAPLVTSKQELAKGIKEFDG